MKELTKIPPSLIEYGALGILLILCISAIIYLQLQINKKDAQIINLTTTSIKTLNSLSILIANIGETTKDLPDKVKQRLEADFQGLKGAIKSIKP